MAGALRAFHVPVAGSVCADVGVSTGGFSDCLLQHGVSRVYAIDVGKGILHWKLRQDKRVVVMESTNARYIERLPEPVDLITIDASFISLKILLPVVKRWFNPEDLTSFRDDEFHGQVIALIKPQFEAGKKEAARGDGVIRDPAVHQKVLNEVLTFSQEMGYVLRGLVRSPIIGPKGNIEFLLWLSC